MQLKHWARPVLQAAGTAAPAESGEQACRVTFHALEAPDVPDVVGAILDYPRKNHVDHIVMGARNSGGLRRHLGSVSAKVAAQADCSVTVVRAPASAPGR